MHQLNHFSQTRMTGRVKPNLTVLTALLTLALLLPACQKCETCSYTYNGSNGSPTTYTFPEVCGKEFKRDAQREACNTAAALAGTTCQCTKN